ncbi:MAG: membrane protein insertase YidC [Candidatus Omnitrophica bacterium]|nr:membrane protein insertase YidC [Candidatus Omnitrophota bacterium]MBU1047481.1 membrane protein insertase YidC [Candidatus Omnitrophota bacterium]MBU1631531.1 membrane protein insertase YidC [Candidatus Omnitrophota bacterium]MBU1766502.1 membrane protein insertase YidC [Candidatus Omnitrophota bacterium]MBU1888844.1 membrane protein insertase YidC [Candidatus Omnitrophota bacterium]
MEKRLILAVFLIIIVLFAFSFINAPQPKKQGQLEESQEKSEEKTERLLNEAVLEIAQSEEIAIKLPLYTALLSEKGGIRSYRLNEYETRDVGVGQLEQQLQKAQQQFRQQSMSRDADINSPVLYSIEKLRYEVSQLKESAKDKGVELISFSELYHDSLPPFLKIIDKNNTLIWSEKNNYKLVRTGSDKVQLIQEIPGVIAVKKEFVFEPDSYLIGVKIIVENIGSSVFENNNFLITCGPDVGIDDGIRAYTKFEPAVFVDNQLKREKFGRGSQNKIVEKTVYGQIGWVALQNKYFAKILIPNEDVKSAYIHKNESEEKTIGLKVAIPSLSPSQTNEFSFQMYLGPKKLENLHQIGRETSKIVDYGKFGNFFQIVHILKFFHRLTKNYGVAIILLTVLINLVLLPLSLKSFKSMKEMRKLQPEMEKLRKEFKDDAQRMNKEVMELYRRHKVNPAGGCLPMLLQFPIFIGLFMTLRSVIELRGAPFIFWIKDLSLPDALSLPFSLPYIGSAINILPIIMTGVTFVQQKVSGSTGTSQPMMLMFPIFMLFIFYNFPSGLVLYFLCGNVINILAQTWINRPELKKV